MITTPRLNESHREMLRAVLAVACALAWGLVATLWAPAIDLPARLEASAGEPSPAPSRAEFSQR